MKSKLRTARARLEQLNASNAAASHLLYPEHEPMNAPTGKMPLETPSQSAQPAECSLPWPSDLKRPRHQRAEQGQGSTDAYTITAPANDHEVVHHAVRGEDVPDDFDLCVICIESAPQVRFQPCCHTVACKPCASRVLLQTGECPMCRCQLSALELLPV